MKAHALLAISSLMGLTPSPLTAEDYKPAFVVTYLEVSPDSVDQSRSLLKTYAAAAQKAAGTVQFENLSTHRPKQSFCDCRNLGRHQGTGNFCRFAGS